MITNFQYWITQNAANGRNYHEGRYWTYNSYNGFAKIFPYWSAKQIRRIVAGLVDKGVLIVGNFNVKHYDNTAWYAFTDAIAWVGEVANTTPAQMGKGARNGKHAETDTPPALSVNALADLGKPIPLHNTDTKPTDKKTKKNKKGCAPGQPGPDGSILEEPVNGPSPSSPPVVAPPPKEIKGLYQQMVDVYFEWYKALTTVEPDWGGKEGGLQGKAMKELIEYFIRQIYHKAREQRPDYTPTDEETIQNVILSWRIILRGLSEKKVEAFLYNATKVNQIKSNLQNIINQLKNGTGKKQFANKAGATNLDDYKEQLAREMGEFAG